MSVRIFLRGNSVLNIFDLQCDRWSCDVVREFEFWMVFNDSILVGNAIPLFPRLYSTTRIAAAIPPPPPSRLRKGNNSTPIFGHSRGTKSWMCRTDGPIRPTDNGRSIFRIPFPNRKSQPYWTRKCEISRPILVQLIRFKQQRAFTPLWTPLPSPLNQPHVCGYGGGNAHSGEP
jgi:hypothetical protein